MADRLLVALREIALVLWVGSLLTAGGLVAPLLFQALPDRRLAGDVAGRLFETTTWVGFAAAAVVLVVQARRGLPRPLGRIGMACAAAMVLVAAVGHFAVRPVLIDLRAQAAGQPVMATELAVPFRRWHAVSGSLYLAAVLLGIGVVVAPRGHPR
jgi:hypothetical protein